MNKKEINQELKKAGIRITPQRLAICQQVLESKGHPTVAMIYRQLKPDYPSLSLATVYNTLDTLANFGIINEIGYAGDHQVHYDGEREPHIHVICVSCHKIIDMRNLKANQLNQEVGQESGYQVIGSRLIYYGLCSACQKKNKGTQSDKGSKLLL